MEGLPIADSYCGLIKINVRNFRSLFNRFSQSFKDPSRITLSTDLAVAKKMGRSPASESVPTPSPTALERSR
jgi:hypothetical protein